MSLLPGRSPLPAPLAHGAARLALLAVVPAFLAGCPFPEEPPADFSDCRADDGADYDLGGGTEPGSEVTVDGDTLHVFVGYGGGCEEHLFAMCWPDGTFLESSPVQVNLELWHGGTPDSCEAYITEELTFDLVPLRDAWHDAYGAGAGEITIHLGEYSVAYTFE